MYPFPSIPPFFFFSLFQLKWSNWLLQHPSGSYLATDTTPTDPAKFPKTKLRRAARAASCPANKQPPPPTEPYRVLRARKRPAARTTLAPPMNKRLYTKQPPIKTSLVTKEHYWVFDFNVTVRGRDHTALYTMRCPSSRCDNPVFSKHPLRSARAEQHFKRCGVRFRDTADLVRRYARLGKLSDTTPRPWLPPSTHFAFHFTSGQVTERCERGG